MMLKTLCIFALIGAVVTTNTYSDVNVTSGAPFVILPCLIGNGSRVVIWSKDSTVLKSDRYPVTFNGSLIILNVTSADSGKYMVSSPRETADMGYVNLTVTGMLTFFRIFFLSFTDVRDN